MFVVIGNVFVLIKNEEKHDSPQCCHHLLQIKKRESRTIIERKNKKKKTTEEKRKKANTKEETKKSQNDISISVELTASTYMSLNVSHFPCVVCRWRVSKLLMMLS